MAIDLVAVLRLDDQISQSLKKVALGATAGFAAITAGAAASVAKFAEIDSQLRMAGAVAGATSSEFEALKQATIDLGSSSTKSMGEIAESFTEMAASGFEVNEAIAAMPGIIKASEASGESLALAAENVSAALNIWSLEASEAGKVADILTMSANVSAAGIVDLGQALKYAGAPAAVLGMDLASVSAAIGVMVDSGIDGSSAGTSLRAALLALNNPANAQEKIMKSLGFSIRDASGEAKSLVGIVADMTKATEHMTAADRLATVGKLVGTEAASGFLTLMSRGPDELQAMTDALRDSAGIAEETANRINQGLGALFKSIRSKKEALMFQIGDALDPIASRIAGVITKINFNPLIVATSKVSDAMASAFDVIKDNWSTLKPIIKPVIGLIGSFVVALGLIGGGVAIFMALSTAVTFLSGPIALVAGAIALIGTGFTLAYQKSKPFRKAIEGIGSAFKSVSEIFKNGFKGYASARDILEDAGFKEEQIQPILKFGYSMKAAFDKLKSIFKSTAHIFTGEHKAAIDVLKSTGFSEDQIGLIRKFGYGVKSAFDKVKGVFDGIGTMMMSGGTTNLLSALGLSPEIASVVDNFIGGLSSKFSKLKDMVANVIGIVWDYISNKITQLQPTFVMLGTIFENLKSIAVSAFTTLWGIAGPILSALWSVLQIVGNVVMLVFNNIIVPAFTFATTAARVLWTVMGPVLQLIGAAIAVAFGVLKIVWDTILGPFLAFLAGTFTVGMGLATKIVSAIGSAFEKVGSFISSAAGYVKDFAKFLSNVKVPDWVGKMGGGAVSFVNNVIGGSKKDGSHYNGIGRIGWDGYIAELHTGERVLNRFEADQYDAIMGGEMQVAGVSDFKHESASVSNTTINNTTTNNNGNNAAPTQGSTSGVVITGNNFTVREDADIEKIAYSLAKLIERQRAQAS